MNTIQAAALSLPAEERAELLEALRLSLRPDADTRGGHLLEVMADILGIPSILRTKKPAFVWARAVVAFQLRSEGYTLEEIGRQLGKDHSSVSYLLHKVEWASSLPSAYKKEMQLLREFNKRIEQ